MTSPRCSETLPPGLQCVREPHDDDMHQFDGALPPIVNQLVAAAVDDLERHTVILQREIRRTRISWRWAMAAAAVNLGAAVFATGSHLNWW